MPMWRCPHCGTPQAETARCWVCRRSSTTCSTCRHFRRSVAAQLGYCGLDRRRTALSGNELRGCWTAGPIRDSEPAPAGAAEDPGVARSPGLRLRGFVPVEFVRDDAAGGVGYGETAAQVGQSGVAVTSVTVRGAPRPDPDGPWPDPIAALAEPGTLFLDTDL